MDIAKTQPVITIAGQQFQVRYLLSDLDDIEALAAGPGRHFHEMSTGSFKEKVAIIWAGVRHGRKEGATLTTLDVRELLQRHQDAGGNWSRDVFQPCYVAALYCGLGGNIDEKDVDAYVRAQRQANGEGLVGEAPKAAVPAAQ